MSALPPDPLDPELRALFDAEAAYSDMPASAPGHILAKVGAGLLAVPVLTAATQQAAAKATAWHALKKTATWIAFGAGAVSGAAGYATVEHAAAHRAATTLAPIGSVVEATPPPSASSADPAPTVSVPTLSMPSASAATSAATAPAHGSGTASGSEDGDLAAERAQLEVARTALARGQAAAALGVLHADAAARPHGRLAEERDSMTIQALALAGRTDEARARATSFKRRYPRSLFLPVVQAAVTGE